MTEQKEGNFEAFVEKIKRKRRRKGDGDATVPIDDPIQPNPDEAGAEAPIQTERVETESTQMATAKENLTVAKKATPVLKSGEKNYAEFLLARSGNMLACRRSVCGRKAYPIGGSLGSLTLEQLALRQGWIVTKGNIIHSELNGGKSIAWYAGDAKMTRRHGSNPIWSDRGNVERSDHLHDDALSALFGD